MATETIQVDAVISPDNWTLSAGASKVLAVNTPDDDATSYIASGATINTVQSFTTANPTTIKPSDLITNVTVRNRCQRGGSLNAAFQAIIAVNGGTNAFGPSKNSQASWSTFTSDFTTDPDGAPWTLESLNGLQVAIMNTQTRDVWCSTLSITITYTPVATRPGNMAGGLSPMSGGFVNG